MMERTMNINIESEYLMKEPKESPIPREVCQTLKGLLDQIPEGGKNIQTLNINITLCPSISKAKSSLNSPSTRCSPISTPRICFRKHQKPSNQETNYNSISNSHTNSGSSIWGVSNVIESEGYLGGESSSESPKSTRVRGKRAGMAESLFDYEEINEEASLGGADLQNERVGNMKLLIQRLKREYFEEGIISALDLKNISTGFLTMFAREFLMLHQKYGIKIPTCWPPHPLQSKCKLCFQALVLNNLLRGNSLSSILTIYFHYLHSLDYDQNVPNMFDIYKGNKFNMEILFRKLELKYYYSKGRDSNIRDYELRRRLDLVGSIARMKGNIYIYIYIHNLCAHSYAYK